MSLGGAALVMAGCGSSTPPEPSTVTETTTVAASDMEKQRIDEANADLDRRRTELDARESAIATSEAQAAENTFTGDGTFLVGQEIAPGTWRAVPSGGCYWARLSSLSGGVGSIIDNENASGPTITQIAPSDLAFKTERCGVWTRIG